MNNKNIMGKDCLNLKMLEMSKKNILLRRSYKIWQENYPMLMLKFAIEELKCHIRRF